MEPRIKSISIIFLFCLTTWSAFGQRGIRGIVVDSVSLKALSGVHVKVKGTYRVAVTSATGSFKLSTTLADTLVLTMIGYNTVELPLLFEEEDIMIRMGERILLLDEVTITGNRLFQSDVERTVHKKPAKMTTAEAFSSPWDYFSKGQKEARKVTKLINENDRIKTYIEVINDQEIREDIMYDHKLTEVQYYAGLAKFNEQSRDVLYATDPNQIISSLKSFFKRMYP